VLEVAAADYADHHRILIVGKCAGDCLRHSAIPGQLGVDEMREFFELQYIIDTGIDVGFEIDFGRVFLAVGVEQKLLVGIEPGQRKQIGFVCQSRVGQTHALRLFHGLPTLPPYFRHQFTIDVECDRRQSMLARKMQQRQIQVGIVSPQFAPFGLFEKFAFVELARAPGIERRLHPARQHLQADDHVGMARMQNREHVVLPAVMRPIVVNFTQQHHARGGEIVEQCLRRKRIAAARVEPLRYPGFATARGVIRNGRIDNGCQQTHYNKAGSRQVTHCRNTPGDLIRQEITNYR
jgi:hypothetical protein